ncbi:PepSY domain-containing protein [Paenibacillus sp. SC116]|uniref:PepSY domain-containing protein n=1 Tax=Paenibacillus sp. SC116 TaxID=2968986 RepID=UPI00215AA462|nr:PepSY domain-containing protein [Paenibacillus sp. SC116]MCR8844842.1 PepSY domain-containing protein [Paenibacillus sp. SC116]
MKNWVVATVAGAVLVGGVGFGSVVMADNNDQSKARAVQAANQNEVKLSFAQAKTIAKGLFKDAKIDEIELEKVNGRLVYHVEFENRKDKEDEVIIDATTAHVTWEKDFKKNGKHDDDYNDRDDHDDNDDDNDDRDDRDDKQVPTSKVNISKEQAKKIALTQVSGKVDDIELEKKFRNHVYEYVYEVEVDVKKGDDATVYVSAETGKVLKVELED